MTKLEFAQKLENYVKKQKQTKLFYFIFGIILTIFAFIPETVLFLSERMFGFSSPAFAVFGGLCFGKAWDINSGTEEHELLVIALDLLSDAKNT